MKMTRLHRMKITRVDLVDRGANQDAEILIVKRDEEADFEKAAPAVTTGAQVDAIAANVDTDPSPAAKAAGNYRKGHLSIQGIPIAIETPKGATRSGVGPNGPWSCQLPAHYGYAKRTEGADGDQLDVYLGQAPLSPQVHVVDQHDLTGQFDEHKALIGFPTEAEAMSAYDGAFSDGSGPLRRRAVATMTVPDFKDWLKNGDTTKPIGLQVARKNIDDAFPALQLQSQPKIPALNLGVINKAQQRAPAGESDGGEFGSGDGSSSGHTINIHVGGKPAKGGKKDPAAKPEPKAEPHAPAQPAEHEMGLGEHVGRALTGALGGAAGTVLGALWGATGIGGAISAYQQTGSLGWSVVAGMAAFPVGAAFGAVQGASAGYSAGAAIGGGAARAAGYVGSQAVGAVGALARQASGAIAKAAPPPLVPIDPKKAEAAALAVRNTGEPGSDQRLKAFDAKLKGLDPNYAANRETVDSQQQQAMLAQQLPQLRASMKTVLGSMTGVLGAAVDAALGFPDHSVSQAIEATDAVNVVKPVDPKNVATALQFVSSVSSVGSQLRMKAFDAKLQQLDGAFKANRKLLTQQQADAEKLAQSKIDKAYSDSQARDADGRFAGGSGSSESAHEYVGRRTGQAIGVVVGAVAGAKLGARLGQGGARAYYGTGAAGVAGKIIGGATGFGAGADIGREVGGRVGAAIGRGARRILVGKGSPDQARDADGRFASGGGSAVERAAGPTGMAAARAQWENAGPAERIGRNVGQVLGIGAGLFGGALLGHAGGKLAGNLVGGLVGRVATQTIGGTIGATVGARRGYRASAAATLPSFAASGRATMRGNQLRMTARGAVAGARAGAIMGQKAGTAAGELVGEGVGSYGGGIAGGFVGLPAAALAGGLAGGAIGRSVDRLFGKGDRARDANGRFASAGSGGVLAAQDSNGNVHYPASDKQVYAMVRAGKITSAQATQHFRALGRGAEHASRVVGRIVGGAAAGALIGAAAGYAGRRVGAAIGTGAGAIAGAMVAAPRGADVGEVVGGTIGAGIDRARRAIIGKAAHDVSDESRDDHGRWSSDGGGGGAGRSSGGRKAPTASGEAKQAVTELKGHARKVVDALKVGVVRTAVAAVKSAYNSVTSLRVRRLEPIAGGGVQLTIVGRDPTGKVVTALYQAKPDAASGLGKSVGALSHALKIMGVGEVQPSDMKLRARRTQLGDTADFGSEARDYSGLRTSGTGGAATTQPNDRPPGSTAATMTRSADELSSRFRATQGETSQQRQRANNLGFSQAVGSRDTMRGEWRSGYSIQTGDKTWGNDAYGNSNAYVPAGPAAWQSNAQGLLVGRFDPSGHPRDANGKFTSNGGSTAAPAASSSGGGQLVQGRNYRGVDLPVATSTERAAHKLHVDQQLATGVDPSAIRIGTSPRAAPAVLTPTTHAATAPAGGGRHEQVAAQIHDAAHSHAIETMSARGSTGATIYERLHESHSTKAIESATRRTASLDEESLTEMVDQHRKDAAATMAAEAEQHSHMRSIIGKAWDESLHPRGAHGQFGDGTSTGERIKAKAQSIARQVLQHAKPMPGESVTRFARRMVVAHGTKVVAAALDVADKGGANVSEHVAAMVPHVINYVSAALGSKIKKAAIPAFAQIALAALEAEAIAKFDASETRDGDGKWSADGSGGAPAAAAAPPAAPRPHHEHANSNDKAIGAVVGDYAGDIVGTVAGALIPGAGIAAATGLGWAGSLGGAYLGAKLGPTLAPIVRGLAARYLPTATELRGSYIGRMMGLLTSGKVAKAARPTVSAGQAIAARKVFGLAFDHAQKAKAFAKFDESEARANDGKWTGEGGAGGSAAITEHTRVAARTLGGSVGSVLGSIAGGAIGGGVALISRSPIAVGIAASIGASIGQTLGEHVATLVHDLIAGKPPETDETKDQYVDRMMDALTTKVAGTEVTKAAKPKLSAKQVKAARAAFGAAYDRHRAAKKAA